MFLFRKEHHLINYTGLIADLESGDTTMVNRHLAFNNIVQYTDGVVFMLAKMKRPDADERRLSLHKTIVKGNFELAIFNVPWNASDFPYLPLILERNSGLIYGIMLPFNELTSQLTRKQLKDINVLAVMWTGFAMEFKFGINLSA